MTKYLQAPNLFSEHIPWIRVSENAPYFEDDDGATWTPIGQNDAITWPDFQGLFKRREVRAVELHFSFLVKHGVNCIRMMMEYCQTDNRYFEKPVGRFQPNMIQFWDDIFVLCEKHKIRLLLTPFDTFWMSKRWKYHPYNKLNGGPSVTKHQWLSSPEMLEAIKNRFSFFIERWGSSGALFAWDLWNEIDPVHGGKEIENLNKFIGQISTHIRERETFLYQRSHLQTVSAFAPALQKHDLSELIFRHPLLDFATTHFYESGTIDYPKNLTAPTVATGNMVRHALSHVPEGRPFLDTEHGPITYFKKQKHGLPETFDDVYFLYMQWAHLASGATGGGMRWPYRHPHLLTHGMRMAQLNLSHFIQLVDWTNFQRKNLSDSIWCDKTELLMFGCGDQKQAIVWAVRNSKKLTSIAATITIPGLDGGNYQCYLWDTKTGLSALREVEKGAENLIINFKTSETNLAILVRKVQGK